MGRLVRKEKSSKTILDLATIAVFSVAFNSDWHSSGLIWWGVLFLFFICFLLQEKGKLFLEKGYTIWILLFVVVCGGSVSWASSKQLVITLMVGLFVNLSVLLLLRSSIHCREDVKRTMILLLIAISVNGLYMLIINRHSITGVNTGIQSTANRLGGQNGWNANSIGMLMSIGFIIYFYLFQTEKRIVFKILYGLACVLATFIALVTGSRKAFVTVIVGAVAYLLFDAKGKRSRNIIIITGVITILYYIVRKIPYFYAIIGWRLDGALALFIGKGVVDHSTMIRSQFVEAGIKVFLSHPILGVGIDCFRQYNAAITGYSWYAHNDYVEILADLGIVGFLIYYVAYAYLFKNFYKRFKEDKFTKLLFAIFICVLLDGYGAVIYSDFLFQTILMIIFAWFTTTFAGESKKCLRD